MGLLFFVCDFLMAYIVLNKVLTLQHFFDAISLCQEPAFGLCIRHLHISHNAPYLPRKILHKHCFQFLFRQL